MTMKSSSDVDTCFVLKLASGIKLCKIIVNKLYDVSLIKRMQYAFSSSFLYVYDFIV
jgi:hypothetical protein